MCRATANILWRHKGDTSISVTGICVILAFDMIQQIYYNIILL